MEENLPKAYVVDLYRSITDRAKFAAYAALAGPAIEAAGGRFLARGAAVKVWEGGILERTIVIEFDSVETATAAYDSAAYQHALTVLDGGAERDIRVVPGV